MHNEQPALHPRSPIGKVEADRRWSCHGTHDPCVVTGHHVEIAALRAERDEERELTDYEREQRLKAEAEVERMRPLETLLPVVQAHATSDCANPDECLICGCYRAYRAATSATCPECSGNGRGLGFGDAGTCGLKCGGSDDL